MGGKLCRRDRNEMDVSCEPNSEPLPKKMGRQKEKKASPLTSIQTTVKYVKQKEADKNLKHRLVVSYGAMTVILSFFEPIEAL